MIDPALIDSLARLLAENASWDMATAASPLQSSEELANPDVVKVVRAYDGRALYFSRAPIPYQRDATSPPAPIAGSHYRHVGIYAYQRPFLERLVQEPPSARETIEKLEQLRALALGARMFVMDCATPGIGVDSPRMYPRGSSLRDAGLLP